MGLVPGIDRPGGLLYKLRDCNENVTVISRIADVAAAGRDEAALPAGEGGLTVCCRNGLVCAACDSQRALSFDHGCQVQSGILARKSSKSMVSKVTCSLS